MLLGRRQQPAWLLHSSCTWRAHLKQCLGPPRWGTCICNHVSTRCRWPTMLASTRRKKCKKAAQRIFLSLDNRGPHKGSARPLRKAPLALSGTLLCQFLSARLITCG